MDHAIDFIVSIIFFLGSLVFTFITFIDGFLGNLMTQAGIPAQIQIAILLIAAIVMMAYAIRSLGNLFAILLLILLTLLILHRFFPNAHMPDMHVVPQGQVQT